MTQRLFMYFYCLNLYLSSLTSSQPLSLPCSLPPLYTVNNATCKQQHCSLFSFSVHQRVRGSLVRCMTCHVLLDTNASWLLTLQTEHLSNCCSHQINIFSRSSKKKTKILHMANFIQLNCKSRYFRSFSEHYLVALSTGIPTLADFPLFFWHRNQAIGMGPYFLLSPRTVCAFPSACLTGWMSRNSNGSDSFAHILHILRLHWEEMMPFCTICFTRNYVKDRVKNGKAAAG